MLRCFDAHTTHPHTQHTPIVTTQQCKDGFRQYCSYQLIKFCPWDNAPPSDWDSENKNVLKIYHKFLCSEIATKVNVKTAELELVKRAIMFEQNQQVDSDSDTDTGEEEEFTLQQTWEAGKLLPYQIVSRRVDNLDFDVDDIPLECTFDEGRNENVDWSEAYEKLGGESFFAGVDQWISTTKNKHGKSVKASRKRLRGTVDFGGLNVAQAHAVCCIYKKYKRGEGGAVLLYGTAGTGKSHVIKALA